MYCHSNTIANCNSSSILFVLISADLCLDTYLDHTFTPEYCLSMIIIFTTYDIFCLIFPILLMTKLLDAINVAMRKS